MHDYNEFFKLPDASPASMLELAMKTRDNKDFASQFKWLEDRQVRDLEIIDDE